MDLRVVASCQQEHVIRTELLEFRDLLEIPTEQELRLDTEVNGAILAEAAHPEFENAFGAHCREVQRVLRRLSLMSGQVIYRGWMRLGHLTSLLPALRAPGWLSSSLLPDNDNFLIAADGNYQFWSQPLDGINACRVAIQAEEDLGRRQSRLCQYGLMVGIQDEDCVAGCVGDKLRLCVVIHRLEHCVCVGSNHQVFDLHTLFCFDHCDWFLLSLLN